MCSSVVLAVVALLSNSSSTFHPADLKVCTIKSLLVEVGFLLFCERKHFQGPTEEDEVWW